MINLKKIVAVTLAATMCMGVSMTSFASTLPNQDNTQPYGQDSGSANNGLQLEHFQLLNQSPHILLENNNMDENGVIHSGDGVTVKATNGEGERNDQLTLNNGGITKGSIAWNSVNSANEIADILSENGLSVPAGTKVIAIGSGVINGLSDEQNNVLTFGLGDDFTTDVYDSTKYHEGDEIWAMFETGENTGVWEMRSGVVKSGGQVDFNVDHKGGFILIKTMKNGRIVAIEKDASGNPSAPVVVEPDQNGNLNPVTPDNPSGSQGTSNGAAASGSGTSTTSSLGTSPKTGEF